MSDDSDVSLLVREVHSISLRLDALSKEIKEIKAGLQSNQSEVLNRLERVLANQG